MSKDKLITVRIKPELYDSFKVWTENRNSNISDTIRAFILDCLNGTARQNIDNEDTIKKLESSLYDRLYNQLYKELSSQLIDNVYSRIDNEQVGIDDNVYSQDIDNVIDDNKSSQCIDNNIDSEDKEDVPLEICAITVEDEDDDVIEPEKENESLTVNLEGVGSKFVKEEISIEELENRLSQEGKEIGVDVVAMVLEVSKEYLSPSKLSKLHTNKQEVLSKLKVVKKQPKTYSNPYSNLS